MRYYGKYDRWRWQTRELDFAVSLNLLETLVFTERGGRGGRGEYLLKTNNQVWEKNFLGSINHYDIFCFFI